MSTIEIRKRLFDYIRDADDRKVKVIYSIVEDELQTKGEVWTDAFINEIEARTVEFEEGKIEGISWDGLKIRAEKFVESSKK